MQQVIDQKYLLYIERIERLEEEEKGIKEDKKDIYSELKGDGYNAKITRQILCLRKMTNDDRHEMEALLDTYKVAVGLDSGPLFRHADDVANIIWASDA